MIQQPLATILLPLVGGVFCLVASRKTKIPSIIFFLIFGVSLGPGFANWIQPSLLQQILDPIISLLVALVLFEGGASLRISQYREISGPVKGLLTVGVVITFAIGTLAALYFGGLNIKNALLFGGIMVVTGPTVITPILKRIRVKLHLYNILKWEAILIDPLGVVLSVVIFEFFVLNSVGVLDGLGAFVLRFVLGISLGLLSGFIMWIGLSKKWLLRFESEEIGGLYLLAVNLFFYGLSESIISHSGLVVSTAAGVVIGNKSFASKDQVFHFEQQITSFALATLFILISSTIPIGLIQAEFKAGLIVLGFLIFCARPLSVFVSLRKESQISFPEKLFLSSLAPRGIVCAALATVFALAMAKDKAIGNGDIFLAMAFIVIVGSIIFYSVLAPLMAMHPSIKEPPRRGVAIIGANPFSILFAKELGRYDIPVAFFDTNAVFCQRARAEGFDAYWGSGTDVDFIDSVDLKGIGHMIALTPNHELNVLACQTFSRLLGQTNVFRLWDKSDTWDKTIDPGYKNEWGRPLVVSLNETFFNIFEELVQPLIHGSKERNWGRFFKKKGADTWQTEIKILEADVKVTLESLASHNFHFPLFAYHKGHVLFITAQSSLPQGAEVINIYS